MGVKFKMIFRKEILLLSTGPKLLRIAVISTECQRHIRKLFWKKIQKLVFEFFIVILLSVDLRKPVSQKKFIIRREQVSRTLTVGPRDALVLTQ